MTDRPPADQLIGRARELERVTDALAAGRPVLIIGEPGIGKTALARAGAQAAAPPRIWEGGGIATLDWVSYLPYRRALGLPLPDGDATAVARFLIEHANDGAFIVDDLQWVDGDTVTATALVAERIPVVAITRPMPRGRDVRARLAAARFELVELGPLTEAAAAQLASAENPALRSDDATSVARRAGGNPLLVQGFAHAEGATTELALALRARLAELSPAAREALHRVAVLERPAKLDLARDDRRQLLDMGLVTETREGLQVRHALIADAVLEELTPHHLRALHRAVALRTDDPGEAARHWAAAGELARARELALQACASAPREVERARCAALAARCLSGAGREQELMRAMQGLARLSDFPAVDELSRTILPGSVHEPEALRLRARALFEAHDFNGADAAIARGMEAGRLRSDPSATIRLQITAAYHTLWTGDPGDREVERLFSRARDLGAADAEMHVQSAAVLNACARMPHAVELARRGRRLAVAEGDTWAEQESWIVEGAALDNLGRETEGRATTRRGIAEMTAKGHHATATRLSASLADQLVWSCDYDVVLAITDELLAKPGLLTGAWDQTIRSRALALFDLGRDEDGGAVIDEMKYDAMPDRVYWRAWVWAEAYLGRGDAWTAMRAAQTTVRSAVQRHFRPQAGATLARAQWEGDVAITREGREGLEGPTWVYDAEIDALFALQTGRAQEAIGLFEAAIERTGWLRHELRYRLGLAEALDLVDPERATREFEALVDALRRVGWNVMLERVAPLLNAEPGGRRLRATRPRPSAVSAREDEVLTLVGQGLTSRAIAERLAITQPTVESHIRSAMRKLNARTRAEAAAMTRVPNELP